MHSGCRSTSQKSPPDIKVFSSQRKLQAPRDSYNLLTMLVGRFRNRATISHQLVFSSSSSSYLPHFLPPPINPQSCPPSKSPSVPLLYHFAYILAPPTHGVAMLRRQPCQTTPLIRAHHRLTAPLGHKLTLERERAGRIP